MKKEIEHKGLECLAAMNLYKVIDEIGEQEVIELIEDLISGDAFRKERTDEIIIDRLIR